MYQLPVNNLTRIRRARKQVKRALEDIGLEYCKEAAEEFKEFCPDEQFVKASLCLDICTWDPSFSKTQVNLTVVSKGFSNAYTQITVFILMPFFLSQITDQTAQN
uniref:ADNP zinc finger domain-containing protein n=1 Tax=Cyclopterus lumpus TaxID=8103 RepID=A0A8C2ZG48_CYCLU